MTDPVLVADLSLTNRYVNSLYRYGITTLAELTGHTPADLLDIRNFGPGQLAEVRVALADVGLELAPERQAEDLRRRAGGRP